MEKLKNSNHKKSLSRRIFKKIGPGIITGASNDDPSTFTTFAQTGARFGYTQLWILLFSFPLITAMQEMSARIGLVTGKGIAKIIKAYYPRKILYTCVSLLFISNIINIGADLGAMASISNSVIKIIPFTIWLILFALFTILSEVFIPYKKYVNILRILTFSLLIFVFTAFAVNQNWHEIIMPTLIPEIIKDKSFLLNIVALLGTTISPYILFWEADEEVEEEIAQHRLKIKDPEPPHITHRFIRKMRIDTILGMIFATVILFFIVLTTASTMHNSGITSIGSADQIATALKPILGDFAFVFIAIGIIGTGLLSIPVMAGSSSYAISETFNWKEGLYLKFKSARKSYLIIISVIGAGILVNLTQITPFQLLYYTAVINGLIAPPLLFIILHISNNKKIMNGHTNSLFSNILGWTLFTATTVASICLIVDFII